MVSGAAFDGLSESLDGWLPDVLHLTHPRAPELTRDFLEKRHNLHTRGAYLRILKAFLQWAERTELQSLAQLTTADVSNYVKGLQRSSHKARKDLSPRTRAQVLACMRGYFDVLVRGGALPSNPAASVENYRLEVRIGHAKPLTGDNMGRLLDSIDTSTLKGLQDRAVIALMAFSCARVGAVVKMKLQSVYERDGRLHLELEEKRDNKHYVPCHPELEEYLRAFMKRATVVAKDCEKNPGGWLFRRWDKRWNILTGRPLTRMICYRMVKGYAAKIGLVDVTNHSFRATGITTFLGAGGVLDDARRLANHASVNTTKLYDHRTQAVSTTDVDKISYRKR